MTKTNIIGVYEDEDQIVEAIHQIQDKGIKIKDVFTPIPLHGVFEALKFETRLPYATFLYGVVGTSITFAFLYWTSVVSYPLKFGGKPLNSLSFIIIMFVATILIATFLTFMTFFIRQKLFPGKEVKVYDTRATDDKFIIVIDKEELSEAEAENVKTALTESGASEINEVEEEINTKG
ncbi:MAG: DUF3341 domain-containing protein [Bacteroidales bacterium]|nr:DUF3341 domain-containing protein [Bacteroidales bacterium]